MGVQQAEDFQIRQPEQHHEAHDLDAAARGPRAAAHQHEHQNDDQGNGGPEVEIFRNKPRGRTNGDKLEHRRPRDRLEFRERTHPKQAVLHEPRHDDRRAEDEQHGIKTAFPISQVDLDHAPQRLRVQRKIDARDEHEKNQYPLDGRLRIRRDGVVLGREAARRHGRKAVVERVEPIHARDVQQHGQHDRHQAVDPPKREGGVLHPRRELVGARPRHLRPVQLHPADAEQRQHDQREQDDPEAADPVGQAAPHEQAVRQALDICKNRRARGREARRGLKNRIRHRGRRRQHERQPAREARHDPADAHHGEPIAQGQVQGRLRTVGIRQREPAAHHDHQRREQAEEGPVPIPQRYPERQHQRRAHAHQQHSHDKQNRTYLHG